MCERDAIWAVQQYEAVRPILPKAQMPPQSTHAKNLGEIADLFDVFLLDAFGVLNLGDTAIAGAVQRVEFLKNRGKQVLVLTNGACFPAEQALKNLQVLAFLLILPILCQVALLLQLRYQRFQIAGFGA